MYDDNNNIYARWVAGEISDQELKELEGSEVLSELQSILAATDDLSLDKYNQDHAYQKIVKNRANGAQVVQLIPYRKIAAIAAIFIGVIAMFLLMQNRPELMIHEAPYGSTAQIELPDQSIVTLNAGSAIKYDSDKFIKERIIYLEGEALFDVEPGSSFRVETKKGTIEVLGTMFNVRQWGDELLVECYEGSVAVSVESSSLVLSSQQTAISRGEGRLESKVFEHSVPLWQVGISKFDSVPVQLVFEEMARQYDIEITGTFENKIFSGAFSHSSLEKALEEVCIPMDLSYSQDQNKKRVLIQ